MDFCKILDPPLCQCQREVDNMQYTFSLTAIIKGWLAQMISDLAKTFQTLEDNKTTISGNQRAIASRKLSSLGGHYLNNNVLDNFLLSCGQITVRNSVE